MPLDYDREDLAERLRAWAKGLYNYMAAVDFLIESGMRLPVGYIPNYREGQPWIEFETLKQDLEAGRLSILSSGEWATLKLACSLARGELDDTFWRLDPTRQQAFIKALSENR